MEISLVWAAIFGGGAFGVVIALLIAAERELRRFREIEKSAGFRSPVIAGPENKGEIRSARDNHVADLEAEKSQLLAQIAELKGEHGRRLESMDDRLPELEKRVAELEGENSQLSAQVIELRKEVEAKEERIEGLDASQQRLYEMEKRVGELEEEKSLLAAEVTELRSDAEIKQERIRWLERVQEGLPEMERRALDLLNALRTVLRSGDSDATQSLETSK